MRQSPSTLPLNLTRVRGCPAVGCLSRAAPNSCCVKHLSLTTLQSVQPTANICPAAWWPLCCQKKQVRAVAELMAQWAGEAAPLSTSYLQSGQDRRNWVCVVCVCEKDRGSERPERWWVVRGYLCMLIRLAFWEHTTHNPYVWLSAVSWITSLFRSDTQINTDHLWFCCQREGECCHGVSSVHMTHAKEAHYTVSGISMTFYQEKEDICMHDDCWTVWDCCNLTFIINQARVLLSICWSWRRKSLRSWVAMEKPISPNPLSLHRLLSCIIHQRSRGCL